MKDKEIIDYLDKYLNDMFDILNNNTFKCGNYLLKYIYEDDLDAYLKFDSMYHELSNEEKKQVCINVAGNLINYCNDKGKIKKYENK